MAPDVPRILAPFRRRAALAAALLLAACGDRGPITIGVAGAFGDPIGAPMRLAARLAVEEINAAGGVRGRPLQLLERDDSADPDSAVRVAADLYASDAVAVVGHLFSSTTLAAAPIYNGGDDPLVELSPSSSAPEVRDAGPYTFRVCPSDLAHGTALARWVAGRLDLQEGAVFYVNDAYGRGIRQAFVQQYRAQGGRILAIEPYLDASPDMTPHLERLLRLGRPRFLFVAGNRSEAERILQDTRALGLGVPVVGGDGLEGIEGAGAVANGTYISAAYHPSLSSTANRAFIAAYRQRYPEERPPNQPAAATYDAVKLLAEVIADVGPDRRAIRDRLAQVGLGRPAYEGATGSIAFDSLGDVPDRQVYVTVARDGDVLLAGGL